MAKQELHKFDSVALVVLASPEQAAPLLKSFDEFATLNLNAEEEGERVGEPTTLDVLGREYPAHRGTRWKTDDCSDVLDDWTFDQDDKIPFLVIYGYLDTTIAGRVSGPQCGQYFLEKAKLAKVLRYNEKDLVHHENFDQQAVLQALTLNPHLVAMRAELEHVQFDEQTPDVNFTRAGPRL